MENEILIGKYALSFILAIFLSFLYNIIPSIPNRVKAAIAAILGISFGVVAMYYNEPSPYTFIIWVDYVMAGFLGGCSAVGIYEIQKSARGA